MLCECFKCTGVYLDLLSNMITIVNLLCSPVFEPLQSGLMNRASPMAQSEHIKHMFHFF
jgi:hypothetical protein